MSVSTMRTHIRMHHINSIHTCSMLASNTHASHQQPSLLRICFCFQQLQTKDRSASSSSLQGEKERGDRGPAPRRSAADAAPKKNGDQAKRARALRRHGVMKHPSIVPCMVKGAGNTAGELTAGPVAGPSLNMLKRKRSGRGRGHMWLR